MPHQGGLTADDVERRVRAVFEVWNTLDPERIMDLYSGGSGFGYRTRAFRSPPSKDNYRRGLEFWLSTLASYSIKLDEVHALADGDVGVAWGMYHEEFQEKGGEPQVLRGRFSETVTYQEGQWRTLFYHRDMTPFDESGNYIAPREGASSVDRSPHPRT